MSKIRINELARELEVKPGRILELLPEVGVTEKKTHSSSLDDDVAANIRRLLGFEDGVPAPARAEHEVPVEAEPVLEAEPAQPPMEPPAAPPPSVPPAPPASTAPPPVAAQPVLPPPAAPAPPPPAPPPATVPPRVMMTPPPVPSIPMPPVQRPPEPPAEPAAPARAAVSAEPSPTDRKPLLPPLAGTGAAAERPSPLRPPLAGTTRPAVPSIPIPTRPPAPPRPPVAAPAIPVPPAQVTPSAPTAAAPMPGAARPAPTVSAPKPGQILTGPRQPLPSAEPPRAAAPGMPPPPAPRPPAERPPTSMVAPGAAQPSRPLVGRPAPRPVVPPRPDMVARLSQAQPKPAVPGAPQMRSVPGAPLPGQPIYRGPLRPGQPVVRGPGMPGAPSGLPGRTVRGRGTHPTSPLPPEPSTLPAADHRRHQTKPARGAARDREIEEGKLRPMSSRREEPVVAANKEITIGEGITVKELAEKLGIKASLVIKKLVDRKIFATINQTLDVKLAEDIAQSFGATSSRMSFEEEATWEVELQEETSEQEVRAPVVTVMGHVDHGKTSLLDSIRESEVAAHEAGGITQHIGASVIEHSGKKIVFIDTPGHEAFTRMRARGAKITDIVVLVVAADDGVMPQTVEAIDHARAAKVPIVVAMNKVDKPDAQPDRIKQQLSDRGLLAEDWGGDVIMVPVSAKTRQNIDALLDYLLLVAEMQSLKANRKRPGICTVLEAKLDRGRGPVATVLVRNGTLRVGDYFICGTVFSRVRALLNDRGEPVQEAEPSTPVEILGLESLPEVGESLQVVADTAKAKQIVMYREHKARETALAKTNRISLETLHQQLREGEIKELNIILKADVGGSAEVLRDTLEKISNDKVRIKVIHSGVGAITESDVLLASTSDAIVIGFNVRPERTAAQVAEQEKVDIRLHTIIYDLTQEIRKAMVGLLEPVYREVYKGRAEVRDTFRISKVGTVAGCYVLDGVFSRGTEVRLLRDNVVVHTGRVGGLKRFKDDVSEVKNGFECGISLDNYNDVKPGDVLEAFITERVAPEGLM